MVGVECRCFFQMVGTCGELKRVTRMEINEKSILSVIISLEL